MKCEFGQMRLGEGIPYCQHVAIEGTIRGFLLCRSHSLYFLAGNLLTATMLANQLADNIKEYRYNKTLNVIGKELKALKFVVDGMRGEVKKADWKKWGLDVTPPQSGKVFWGYPQEDKP